MYVRRKRAGPNEHPRAQASHHQKAARGLDEPLHAIDLHRPRRSGDGVRCDWWVAHVEIGERPRLGEPIGIRVVQRVRVAAPLLEISRDRWIGSGLRPDLQRERRSCPVAGDADRVARLVGDSLILDDGPGDAAIRDDRGQPAAHPGRRIDRQRRRSVAGSIGNRCGSSNDASRERVIVRRRRVRKIRRDVAVHKRIAVGISGIAELRARLNRSAIPRQSLVDIILGHICNRRPRNRDGPRRRSDVNGIGNRGYRRSYAFGPIVRINRRDDIFVVDASRR